VKNVFYFDYVGTIFFGGKSSCKKSLILTNAIFLNPAFKAWKDLMEFEQIKGNFNIYSRTLFYQPFFILFQKLFAFAVFSEEDRYIHIR
jgi:hypothetical protein